MRWISGGMIFHVPEIKQNCGVHTRAWRRQMNERMTFAIPVRLRQCCRSPRNEFASTFGKFVRGRALTPADQIINFPWRRLKDVIRVMKPRRTDQLLRRCNESAANQTERPEIRDPHILVMQTVCGPCFGETFVER